MVSLIMSLFFVGCGSDSSNKNPYTPTPPENGNFTVTATALSSSSIRVTWTAQSNANSYWVFYSTKSNPTSSELFMVYSGSNTTYTMNGLSAGTTYYFRVYINDLNGLYKQASATTNPDTSVGGKGSVMILNYTIYKDDPITNIVFFDSGNQKIYEDKDSLDMYDFEIYEVPAGTYHVEIKDDYTSTFETTSFTVSAGSDVLITYIGGGLIVSGGIPASDVQGIYYTSADLGYGYTEYYAYLASNGVYFAETEDEEIVEFGEYTKSGSTITFWPDDYWGSGSHTGNYSSSMQRLTAYGATWEKLTD